MAEQEPLDTTSQDAEELPERIRVHALAKLLGTTSKRILAKLTELGSEARSAQSNVDRAVAHSVRRALAEQEQADAAGSPAAGTAGTAGAPGSAGAPESASPDSAGAPSAAAAGDAGTAGSAGTTGAPPAKAPRGGRAAATAAPAGSADAASGPAPDAATEPADTPASGTAGTDSGSTGTAGTAGDAPAHAGLGLFTSPVRVEEPEPAPVYEPAAVAAPLFLPPDAAAAEEERRRRRAEREARRRDEEQTKTAPESDSPAEDAEDAEDRDDDRESGEQGDGDGQPRRRRRGRRGRGRGRGEQHSDDGDADEQERGDAEPGDTGDQDRDTEPAGDADRADTGRAEVDPAEAEKVTAGQADGEKAADTDDEDDEDDLPDGSTRRRRRRRRRKVAGESGEAEPADDDPPNTVVHEREPRNKRSSRQVDEVQGISGSTRLEAKRQRRRDGREAGRRRPPILTESEFLARRESVDRVMVVREKSFPDHPTATQVAVLEDDILVEHFVTSTGQASMVGNVYLGKVQNVLPSMEAAFVDIGRGRNGVLYAGEVNWEAAGLGGRERKIEQALKPGDQVLVQVSKDPVGHKGARLTTQISLAGRFLVYVPGGTSTGISRKLPDTERKRLKEILRDIVPDDAGVIIRTASEGVSAAELGRDVERLQATWRTIEEQAKGGSGAPKTLYEEPDLLVKVIRDLFNEDFSKLVIEGDRAWSTVENYIRTVAPDMLARVHRHDNGNVDAFQAHRIDEQLAKALDRKVWLPSGGTLVIDRTEAMTVIDVNTGKFTGSGGSNLEETVTRNNLEAAEEIVRQMRLRDIGGMIVVDFIDMVLESNRDLVLRRLTEALGRDRTRHQVSEVTSLGLVQMTRKKLGTGLVEAFSTTCEHCHGRGILVHSYPVEPGAAEESGGRGRESGSRRRRGRDKEKPAAPASAPAPAGNGASAPPESEEDAAVKRAHPVALAMAAAHQAEEAVAGVATDQADQAAVRPSGDDVTVVVGAGATGSDAEADAEKVDTPPTGRRRRSRRAARSAGQVGADLAAAERVAVEQVAGGEAAAATSSAIEPGDVPSAEAVAATADQVALVEPADAAEASTAEASSVAEASAAAAGNAETAATAATAEVAATRGTAATEDTAGADGAGGAEATTGAAEATVGAGSAAEAGAPAPAAGSAPAVEPAAADGEAAAATASAIEPGDAPSPEAAATAAREVAAATAPRTADGAAGDGEGTGRPSRRRRVARSAAAPSADSTGAVFVLSGAEAAQGSAPVADSGADEPVPVPRARPRRRAVGRPAGPPVDEG